MRLIGLQHGKSRRNLRTLRIGPVRRSVKLYGLESQDLTCRRAQRCPTVAEFAMRIWLIDHATQQPAIEPSSTSG